MLTIVPGGSCCASFSETPDDNIVEVAPQWFGPRSEPTICEYHASGTPAQDRPTQIARLPEMPKVSGELPRPVQCGALCDESAPQSPVVGTMCLP